MIINQGNNFSQIIASNINASLYQYLDKNISEIKNYTQAEEYHQKYLEKNRY